jgi:hypothetical protein
MLRLPQSWMTKLLGAFWGHELVNLSKALSAFKI